MLSLEVEKSGVIALEAVFVKEKEFDEVLS